jgi:hypothetical protein
MLEAVRAKPRPFTLMLKYPPAKQMLPKVEKELQDEVWGPNPTQPSEELDMMDEYEILLDKVVSEGHDSLSKMEDKKLK